MRNKRQKTNLLINKTKEILGVDVLDRNGAEWNERREKVAKVLESLSTQYGIDTHHQESLRTYAYDYDPKAHEYAWETGDDKELCATAVAHNILYDELYN